MSRNIPEHNIDKSSGRRHVAIVVRAALLPLLLLAASACGDEEYIPEPNTTCNPNPDENSGTICTRSNVITTGELTGEVFSPYGDVRNCVMRLLMTPLKPGQKRCFPVAAPAYYWFQSEAPAGFKPAPSQGSHVSEGDEVTFGVHFASQGH